ncbi:MAG TPA: extracellular solute-binding protein [Paenibacillus sp.]|nr:extracellular solute-binding protein [Paenibacillus sp.]
MKKRALYRSLAFLAILSVAAGCSNGSDGAAEDAGTSEPAGNAAPATAEPPAGSEEKPALRILGSFAPNIDPEKDIMVGEIEQRTGYDVEYVMLPQDKPDEKLNLEVASGANYDILTLTAPQFYKLAAQGALMPLDDLIAQHGANIKNAIKEESWDLSRMDGSIYGIPQKNERPNIEHTIAFRQDILDGLGLKPPETIAEFVEVLKAVKTAHPDMIPLTGHGTGDGLFMRTLMSGYSIFTDWTEIDGKLVTRFERPEMKEYIGFLQQLYAEGLLDQDWGVNKVASMQEKFTSGKAFAMPFGWFDGPGVTPALEKNVPGAKLGVLNPLKDASGNAGVQANLRIQYIHAIPKNAKNAEHAMKYMDMKLDPAHFTYLTLGEEGVTFTVENGAYTPIMPIFTEKRGSAYWFLNGIDEHKYPDMWLARLRRDPNLFAAFEQLNKEYDKFAKQNPVSFAPPLDAVSKYQQSLGKMQDDYVIKVMMGGANVAEHDSFMQEWGAAGGNEIGQALNEWYATTK